MKNEIKKLVKEHLNVVGKVKLFNEIDFNYYYRKITGGKGNFNPELLPSLITSHFKHNEI
jgi:hypothetical protein